MKNEHLEKQVHNAVSNAMAFQETNDGRKLLWFFCFGTMLEYIADRTFHLDYDIDIGILYEEYNPEKLISSFESYGYKLDKVFLHDKDKKPLNIHFRPTGALKGTPDIDVYAWIKSGNLRYHTYDMKKEGVDIPSEYTFKGIKDEWICPDDSIINRIRSGGPETDRVMSHRGVWQYDIFGDHSGYVFPCPYYYGHLLDEWYCGWRFRQYYKGQSKSQWTKTIKSCKDL